MKLRCASYNALADAWLGNGDYSHAPRDLLLPRARIPYHLKLIDGLQADVIGLQEVEWPLVSALKATGKWQTFWSQKEGGDPDGCLMLVRQGIVVKDGVHHTKAYTDGSGHIMQSIVVEDATIANTHIEFAKEDDPNHSGVFQTKELLEWVEEEQSPRSVILADCNGRPNGRVRALFKEAGFNNVCGNEPTALINQMPAALDVIAVKGVRAKRIKTAFKPKGIPSIKCPSDHIPVMADIEIA